MTDRVGPILIDPRVDDRPHPQGSEPWAKAIAMQVQQSYWAIDRSIRHSARAIQTMLWEALDAPEPPHVAPWEVWPPQAQGRPRQWVRLATGVEWEAIAALVALVDPDDARALDAALTRWRPDARRVPGATLPVELNPTGTLLLSPMLGRWDQYPTGTPRWAMAMAMHLQHDWKMSRCDGNPQALLRQLRTALTAPVAPWEMWPLEVEGDRHQWLEAIAGTTWERMEQLLSHIDPAGWEQVRQLL